MSQTTVGGFYIFIRDNTAKITIFSDIRKLFVKKKIIQKKLPDCLVDWKKNHIFASVIKPKQ